MSEHDPADAAARAAERARSVAGDGGWEPPSPEELARLLPIFAIESLLGRGGMGAVYKGRQAALDRQVAIKLLPAAIAADAEFVSRFEREARTLARLQHSGIVAIYEFGQTEGGHLYFVMEYVDGSDLHQVLHGPGLKPGKVLELVVQLCDALHYAHQQGVIHRDIKPANVLLNMNGRVKLADFGLARPLRDESAGITVTRMVMGTLDYMSPEQRVGLADHRSDIFAMGVLIYEMLTGRTPLGAFHPPSKTVRLDVRIDGVVLKALQAEPELRYQQVSELKADVERILRPVVAVRATRKPAAKRMRGVGVAFTAVLLFGSAYAAWRWGGVSPAVTALFPLRADRQAVEQAVTPIPASAQPTQPPAEPTAESAELENVLPGTRWTVSTELGERAWGDLSFREGHEFMTMNGPQGEWKVAGGRTVELGRSYVLKIAPDLASFVATKRSGPQLAKGERKIAAAVPLPEVAAATPASATASSTAPVAAGSIPADKITALARSSFPSLAPSVPPPAPAAPPPALEPTLTASPWKCTRLIASDPPWTEQRFSPDGAVTAFVGETVVARGRWQLAGPRVVKVLYLPNNVPFYLQFDPEAATFEESDERGVRRYRGTRQAVVKPPAPTVLGTMAGRMSEASRERMRDMNGGKKKSEAAVFRGLRWLVGNQAPDGSWGSSCKSAMTGFALLALLGHGETPDSPEFGATVRKGVDWLKNTGGAADGKFATFNQPGVYEHGIATFALAEYFALTHDRAVEPVLKQAVGHIVRGQGPDGGWMYAYDHSQSDTSVSGWQIQALRAAYLGRLEVDGIAAALDKAMGNLKRVRGPKGGFGYRESNSERYSLSGVGVFCTYAWKGEKDELVRDGIKYILDDAHPKVDYKGNKADLYAWYYHTQACLLMGGTSWSTWNRMFQDQIADAQQPDGSWPPTGNPKPHGPEAAKDGIGPVYRTALCTLMLEVFYRYSPFAGAR